MHDLFEGILEYSRAGRIDEEDEEIDLNLTINGIIDILAPRENIEFQIEDSIPNIIFGPTKIIKILQNIIGNAIKFMNKSKGLINVKYQIKDDYIILIIVDNGMGIDKKNFDRIFEMFQTVKPKDDYKGLGIGLTTAKKILQNNGGDIYLKSELEVGSTFFIKIPIIDIKDK